jgi:hypothetical protein
MSILIVSAVALTVNIFLGRWRVKYRKFTFKWWLIIHASIPLIIPLRIWLDTPAIFIPLFIGLAVAGQFIGSRICRNTGKIRTFVL